jgi:hypothetical protein
MNESTPLPAWYTTPPLKVAWQLVKLEFVTVQLAPDCIRIAPPKRPRQPWKLEF